MQKQVELLAPAGCKEQFYGAINAGADAIYMAGNQYGARAYAENFSEEELIACLRHAHLRKKKVYMTVNTLVKEKELQGLPEFLRPFYEEGLDGVIVQDFGVLSVIRECFPGLPLHASTQMSVTGTYGAALLKDLGVVRIVPARELLLKEIVKLKKESGMELECFIHGAMCYSYSGQCLFSSVLGGRSGNRGRCAQPCRLPYTVIDHGKAGKECYPLSLKDMCTIEVLPALLDAGIDSFKIEGRMKSAEYAAGVTAYYRKQIDLYYEGKTGKPSKSVIDDLSHLYLRSERGTGYYYLRNGKEMVTLNNPAYSASNEALLLQIRDKYLKENSKIKVSMWLSLKLGENASLTLAITDHPETSVTVSGTFVEQAQKAPITRENVVKQLKKLGESSFELSDADLSITMDENVFLPLKSLNDLRREGVAALEEVVLHGE